MSKEPIYVDFSLPLAELLRKGTAVAHEEAAKSQGAAWMVRGELDREEYIRFLMMLWHVYDTLERGLERHASHPVLAFTYNPALLSRAPALSADIAYFLQTNEADWQNHPMHMELLSNPPPVLSRYLDRLNTIASSEDPSTLLSHAYVRYLGDLSGGQVIRSRVSKAYGLEGGSGVSFFEFKPLGGSGTATIGDMKKIKEWYRENMNSAAGDDQELKADIVEEALIVFELNGELFAALRPPSSASLESSVLSLPPLGDPVTPIDGSFNKLSGGGESTVLYEEKKPAEKLYSVSAVIAVVAAMSLAHFVLVTGGFTGDRGMAKLEALRRWLFTH
ncbi:heme oxygenase [Rhodofomes roseus]|uniref:Heme oxygenase n=1 Tax=Rhodofomes roseus TaxID=34475 RepID=A0ABQ8KS26_9APHY|nr:heme oxygenase [Rhodofomes roseus]KAH9841354.1 heme oxygenase [Rhodofomes roseus]